MRASPRRGAWTLAVAIALVVLVASGAWLVGALTARAREIAIVALSRAFHRDVQIGAVSGDPWRGLVLHDVAVRGATGREPPLLAARRVTIHFDPVRMARDLWARRGTAGAISTVLLDEPSLRLERDAAGRWNLGGISIQPATAGEAAFRGRIVVLDGAVEFTDSVPGPSGVFRARIAELNGDADFADVPRIAFRASMVEVRGGRRTSGRVAGAYLLGSGLLDVDLRATAADAGAWGPYLLPLPALRILGGEFDAQVHVLRTPRPGRTVTDLSGRLTLRDGRALLPLRQARLDGVTGALTVANRSLWTDGLRGRLNGAPLEVRGEAAFYGEPRVDLAVRSPAADLRTLARLFFPALASRLAGVVRGDLWIVGPISAPRLEGRIVQARGRVDGTRFDDASTRLSLYGGLLSLTDLRGRSAGGRVAGDVLWSLEDPSFFLALRLRDTSAAAVRPWVPLAVPPVSGTLTGALVLRRHDGRLDGAGQGTITQARIAGLAFDRVAASFHTDGRAVAVEHVRLERAGAWASGQGRLVPGGGLDLRVQAASRDVSALPLGPGTSWLAGRLDFFGRLEGTTARPVLAGSALLSDARLGPLDFDSVSGRVVAHPGGLTLDGVSGRRGRAQYTASGTVRWAGATRVSLDLGVRRGQVAVLGRALGLPVEVSGRLDGQARVEGPLTRPQASAYLSLRETEVLGQRVDAAEGAFRWDGRRLVVEGGTLRLGGSTVRVAGAVDRLTGLALDLSAQGFDLRDVALPPIGVPVAGHIDLVGRFTGMPAAPALSIEAASADLTINGVRVDRATGAIRWERRTLQVAPLALRIGEEAYDLEGTVTLGAPPRVAMEARVSGGRLATLLALGGGRLGLPLEATVSGVARVDGPTTNPAATLDLRLIAGRFGTHALRGGHADLALADNSVTIRAFEIDADGGRVAATGRVDLRGESQVEVSGTGLSLDVARPFLRLRRPLLGRVNFTTQLGGTLAAPEVGFDVEIAGGGVEGTVFDSLVASGFYREGQLHVSQALLAQGGHRLRLAGSVPLNPATLTFNRQAPIDLRLGMAEVNLGLLRLVTDRVEEGQGAVEGEVRVGGTLADPRLAGGVTVRDGLLRLRGLQTPLEALRLDLRFENSTLRVADAAARVGGGDVRLSGGARIVPAAGPLPLTLEVPAEAPLALQVDRARPVLPPVADVRVDGTLRAWGTLANPRRPPTLGGRLTFSDGTLTAAAPPPGGGRGGFPLRFEALELAVGQNLTVAVGGVRVTLRPQGQVVLGGTLAAPTLDGEIEAQRGTIFAFNTPFELESGSAVFQAARGVRPQVSARAGTTITHPQVGPVRVTMTVGGIAPDQLTLHADADPPLPQQEILALLGQRAGLAQLLTGDVATALRLEISRRLFAPVSLAIGRALGLDEFVIEYDFEQPLRLRVGRLLLSNLYMTVTTTFEARQRFLWALEYRFARNWRLAFRVDQDSQRELVLWYVAAF